MIKLAIYLIIGLMIMPGTVWETCNCCNHDMITPNSLLNHYIGLKCFPLCSTTTVSIGYEIFLSWPAEGLIGLILLVLAIGEIGEMIEKRKKHDMASISRIRKK